MERNTKLFEILALIVLVAEIAWLLYSLQHKLNQPTVQSRAMHLLIQYALETEKRRPILVKAAVTERIYFWPGNALPIDPDQFNLSEKLDEALTRYYGEEYLTLPKEELLQLRESTIPWLEQDAINQINSWKKTKIPNR